MNTLTVALAQSLVVTALFAVPSLAEDEEDHVYLNAAGRVVVEKQK